MSYQPKHFDRTGLSVDCRPDAKADPLRTACSMPDCYFQANAMDKETLSVELWDHHVAVHLHSYALPTLLISGRLLPS